MIMTNKNDDNVVVVVRIVGAETTATLFDKAKACKVGQYWIRGLRPTERSDKSPSIKTKTCISMRVSIYVYVGIYIYIYLYLYRSLPKWGTPI